MARSRNGWLVEPPATAKIRAKNGDTADVRTGKPLGEKVDRLMQDFVNQYAERYEPVTTVSGYRSAAGNASTGTPVSNSNHRSATAIDVNGYKYPYEYTHRNGYRPAFTGNALAIIRTLLDTRYVTALGRKSIIRWGHDFESPYRDEMHYEIAPGTTNAELSKVLKRVAILNKRARIPGVYRVTAASLNGRDYPSVKTGKVIHKRRKGFTFVAVEKFKKDGRYWLMTKYGTFYAADYCTYVKKG